MTKPAVRKGAGMMTDEPVHERLHLQCLRCIRAQNIPALPTQTNTPCTGGHALIAAQCCSCRALVRARSAHIHNVTAARGLPFCGLGKPKGGDARRPAPQGQRLQGAVAAE